MLGSTPRFFTREMENWFKPEPEVFRPVNQQLYETEETLLIRGEVPGFTEKELDVHVEPLEADHHRQEGVQGRRKSFDRCTRRS